MRRIRCRQLRSVLTAYVDDEISAGERLIVEDHLRQCDACRRRVRREGAVRRRLQRWSAEAREGGAPLAWPAGPGTPPPRRVGTVLRVVALSTATIAIAFVMSSGLRIGAGVPLAARGQIGDSRCAGGHAHASAELRNLSDRDCVQR
ncbi:MAG: zf-HC2 domain-containing protein [Acidobacteria bacterium]|nr:zf-HC2 domain-containing protein [Acidobacteriota bacterium]